MNNLLLVTMQYPPSSMSSGYLRALKFSKFLPEFGWNPIVLSAHNRVYDSIDPQTVSLIPKHVHVYRAFAFNSAKDFSWRGRYLRLLATPDKYVTWIPFAIFKACSIIKKHNIKVIISTYPPESSNLLGLLIHKITHIPWVCDLRDPIYNARFPCQRSILDTKFKLWMEKETAKYSKLMLFTTNLMREYYLARFDELDHTNCHVIYNGYDEDDFSNLEIEQNTMACTRMVHTGLLDMTYRNPIPFLEAVEKLRTQGNISGKNLKIDFIGAGAYFESDDFRQWLADHSLSDVVSVTKRLPYKHALQKQAESDVLLLFQNHTAINMQVPAKLFEYMRIGKTILAIAPNASETAEIVKGLKCGYVIDSENAATFQEHCLQFIRNQDLLNRERTCSSRISDIQRYSRRFQTHKLVHLLEASLAGK